MNKITMRNFNPATLTRAIHLAPLEIKELRKSCEMSQAAFASTLNVSTILISKWERGTVAPSGAACKLFASIKKHGIKHLL